MKMKLINNFFHLLACVSTEQLLRKRRIIKTFDLVSQVPEPKPRDLYMIYTIDNSGTYMIRWGSYFRKNRFDSGGDRIVVYTNNQAGSNLYKVDNMSINPRNILMHSSVRELKCYATRFIQVFARRMPLLGVFQDPKDGHLMLIVNVTGNIETGFSTVVDIAILPSWGIAHGENPFHIIQTKDIVNKYPVTPITIEILVSLLKSGGNIAAVSSVIQMMFSAISDTEKRELNGDIYSIATTSCVKSDAVPPQNKKPKKEQVT